MDDSGYRTDKCISTTGHQKFRSFGI